MSAPGPYQLFQNGNMQEQIQILLSPYNNCIGWRVQSYMYTFGQGNAWSVEDSIVQVCHALMAALVPPQSRGLTNNRLGQSAISEVQHAYELSIKISDIDPEKVMAQQNLPDHAWSVMAGSTEIASNIAWGRSEAIAQAGLAIYKAFTVPSDREMWAKIEEGNK